MMKTEKSNDISTSSWRLRTAGTLSLSPRAQNQWRCCWNPWSKSTGGEGSAQAEGREKKGGILLVSRCCLCILRRDICLIGSLDSDANVIQRCPQSHNVWSCCTRHLITPDPKPSHWLYPSPPHRPVSHKNETGPQATTRYLAYGQSLLMLAPHYLSLHFHWLLVTCY